MARLFFGVESSETNPSKYSISSIRVIISNSELSKYKKFYEEIKHDKLVAIPESIDIG